ncbi:translation factor GUF1 homolog, mitochondrial [Trichonephila clavipes]|nr:translation factor GUF1 homolog, mitochondrial [Trichonephila clavipes]
MDWWPACLEFKPNTTEDSPCMEAMHIESVEAQMSSHWCAVELKMPFKRRRNHFQWRTEFERGSVIVLREGGFSFCDNAERLARNVSTGSNGQGMVLPQEDGVPSGHVALLRRKTAVFNVRLWRIVRRLRHCRSQRQWCQARAHWRTEWRSVVLSDGSRFCLCASDVRVLVRRRPWERLQPNCLPPRRTGPTPGVMIWAAISYDSRTTLVVIPITLTANLYVSLVIQPIVLPFINSIQGKVFQQNNARPHSAVVTQRALQSVDMLPWPARSPDLSPIELQFSNEQKGIKINMRKIPLKNIRNFGIIAHVDHGKSTLSDRLMEFAGNISKKNKNEQVLDKLQVERERGITVKAQTVSLFHEYGQEMYLLNLIDTPGHVDFSYEVNRSLVACQGVILLVDANQGVQAQTVANFNLASTHGLKIIPVLNKIDLKNAKPDIVSNQLTSLFGFDKKEILKVSAKLGTGIEDVIVSVIEKIPPPNGNVNQQFRALQYDSWFTQYHGVICLILIVDGSIQVGEEITSASSGCSYIIKELGILYPEEIPVKELFAGQAGYFRANIKNPKDAKVGDTWFKKGTTVEPLPLIAQSKPMVFAGIFPSDQSKTQDLRKAIEKLILNDSSVSVSLDTSPALGQGWRLGFLGVLHMEVFCQRLHQEFDADVIVTAPGIPYKNLPISLRPYRNSQQESKEIQTQIEELLKEGFIRPPPIAPYAAPTLAYKKEGKRSR